MKDISIMEPHFQDYAKEAAEFISASYGGDESPYLLELEAFAKSLKVRREPESGQLSLLAKAKVMRAPRWPVASKRV